jgi:hypothetical protein
VEFFQLEQVAVAGADHVCFDTLGGMMDRWLGIKEWPGISRSPD